MCLFRLSMLNFISFIYIIAHTITSVNYFKILKVGNNIETNSFLRNVKKELMLMLRNVKKRKEY